MDISKFFTWFLDEVVKLFVFVFNLLDRITFAGVSLLQFILWCLILSAIIPIVFSIARTQSGSMHRSVESHNRKVQKERSKK